MVDAIASSLFAYTSVEMKLLRSSPDIRGRLYLEGNTTVDLLHDFSDRIDETPLQGRYVYVTMHRKEFTESREQMERVFSVLRKFSDEVCPVLFPIHPRTLHALRKFQMAEDALDAVRVLEPLRTFDSLSLIKHAAAVLTDSGCIQEEAYLLNVPCVTIRENTERHLTVSNGANRVTGFERTSIIRAVYWALNLQDRKWPGIYGTPGAGDRIVNRIVAEACEAQPLFEPSFA
jgi:UDP-N-acetylglucosamine 2-epimerase (non-hydrolysing)